MCGHKVIDPILLEVARDSVDLAKLAAPETRLARLGTLS